MAEPAVETVEVTEDKPKKKSGFRGGDANINRNGRPKGIKSKQPTNRELRERELLMLLRKIKPHVAEAVMQAARIMKQPDVAHQNSLRAASILLDAYRRLTLDLYDGVDPDEEATAEVQQQNPVLFSLKMVEPKE